MTTRTGPPPGLPTTAYGLVPDRVGRYLLVRPVGHPALPGQWRLPGGLVEDGESPREALRRELHEELGLRLTAEAPLAIEWVQARTPGRRDRWAVVFTTSKPSPTQVEAMHLQHEEIAETHWAAPATALHLLHPRHAARLSAAWLHGTTVYLEHHQPREETAL